MSNEQTEYAPEEFDAVAVVDEPAVAEPVEAEEVVSSEPKTKAKKSAPAGSSLPASAYGLAVSNSGVDEVHLSKLVYKSRETRKSLSVHHLQRRLADCGYSLVNEKDGWLADLTVEAITAFQADNGLAPTGKVDVDTAKLLFDNDPNVRVVFD